ncbi:hypothetical protein GIB67_012517, partial [Kingdonia uniflora]
DLPEEELDVLPLVYDSDGEIVIIEEVRLRYKCGDEKCEWMCNVRRNCDGHTMELKSRSNITHICRGKAVDKNKLAHAGWVANEDEQLIRICVLIPMRHPWIEYCSEYHTVAKYVTTYNLPIHAINDPSEWGQPGYTVLPPPLVRGPGRPKKQKIKDQDEYLATVGDVENVVLWVT